MFDVNQAEQLKQIEQMKKKILAGILGKEAYERLGRVRMTDPETASQAELYLLQLYQAGKLQGMVTDEQMREILRLISTRKDISITRK